MVQFREFVRERAPFLVPVAELLVARERARRGDRDAAIAVMRQAVDELHQAGRLFYGVWGTGVLVETLVERGAEGDLAEAQEAIDRLANLPADDGSAMREITLLRLRALLARARGDDVAYRDLVGRYRAMAESLGFEGHIAWAEAMIDGGMAAEYLRPICPNGRQHLQAGALTPRPAAGTIRNLGIAARRVAFAETGCR